MTTGGESIEGISSMIGDIPSQDRSITKHDTTTTESVVLSEAVSITSHPTSTATAADVDSEMEAGELDETSFLSFEEWKKQELEKAGQANVDIGHKKSGEKKRDSESIQNDLESLGDEGEIDLNFSAFSTRSKGGEPLEEAALMGTDNKRDSKKQEGAGRQYRSKDAGITCKERFSYASFDAGATILKTHARAKNPKAVLIENKDSYMLSECSNENKFLIIELSVSLKLPL